MSAGKRGVAMTGAESPGASAGPGQQHKDWLRRWVDETWTSLRQKIVAGLGLFGTIFGILTFAFGTGLPPVVRTVGAAGCALLLSLMTMYYIAKSIKRLAVKSEDLAAELDGAWAQVKSLNIEKEEWQKGGNPHRQAFDLGAALSGLVYTKYQAECVLEPTGAFGILTHLSMTATMSGITCLEHHVVAPHAPEELDKVIDLKAKDHDDENVLLKPVVDGKSTTATHLYWSLRAIPELSPGHKIQYSYNESLPPGSFAMTLADMQARGLEWEFFYIRATWPIEKLMVSVTLPPGFVPGEMSYDAWYGARAKVRHSGEYRRIGEANLWVASRNRKTDQIQGQLVVPYPVQGLHYVIKWHPPQG
jgi:hypothetical protein